MNASMSPVEAVMAGIMILNSLGVFVILFKSGVMVGQNDQRWKDLYSRLSQLDARLNTLDITVREGNESKVEIARLQEAVRTIQDSTSTSVRQYRKEHSHD